jgi:hypothetical protein
VLGEPQVLAALLHQMRLNKFHTRSHCTAGRQCAAATAAATTMYLLGCGEMRVVFSGGVSRGYPLPLGAGTVWLHLFDVPRCGGQLVTCGGERG